MLKQHVWGTQYIDELVQVGINQDPENADTALPDNQEENSCERFFWAAQDANYNVLGVVYSTGVLAERYEYTPYGKRTVYSRGWLLADLDDDGAVGASDDAIMDGVYNTTSPTHRADLNGDGKIDIDDVQVFNPAYGSSIAANDPLVHHPRHGSFRGRSSAGNPTPLCEAGHQGLLHDEEFDLVYNRARMLVPGHGRFGQRDPMEYQDGVSLMQYLFSVPLSYRDPTGRTALEDCQSTYLSCRHQADLDWNHNWNEGWQAAIAACANARNQCFDNNVPDVVPLGAGHPACLRYPPNYEYMNSNAQCFCQCAGESPWSQFVRGCLAQLYAQGESAEAAHTACYELADMQNFPGGRPVSTLAFCYATCFDYNPCN